MLRIDSVSYNSGAASVDDNDPNKVLATMNFSGDNYNNYYFNVNFTDTAALTNTTVDDDFVEFKSRVAAALVPSI